MSGEIVDSAKLFYQLLAGNAGIASAVTNTVGNDVIIDIYGPPGIPAGWTIRPGIMYFGNGGPGDTSVPIGRESFDVYCYGRSSPEAREIFGKVKSAIHRKKNTRITIDGEVYILGYSQLMAGPADRVDPVDGWDFVWCSFYVQFIEVTS